MLCSCANIGVTVEGKVVVGRRLQHRAGVHRRHPQGQGSPLCTLASVGSGMAAGAAFGQRRVRDVGAVRSFSTLCNVNDPITHATRLQGYS